MMIQKTKRFQHRNGSDKVGDTIRLNDKYRRPAQCN